MSAPVGLHARVEADYYATLSQQWQEETSALHQLMRASKDARTRAYATTERAKLPKFNPESTAFFQDVLEYLGECGIGSHERRERIANFAIQEWKDQGYSYLVTTLDELLDIFQ